MKKYLLIGLLLLAMIMTLVACGSDENASDTDVNNPAPDQAEVKVPNDTDEPVEPDDTKEPVEPDDTEEPIVEMVDWETWATQADHDEVCLVVWNEKMGIQEIIPSVVESKKVYEIKEGDKFAIPYRDNITYVMTEDSNEEYEECKWENSKYIEFSLSVGEIVNIYVGYADENGETINLCYCFK